jgi:hypothetical protein
MLSTWSKPSLKKKLMKNNSTLAIFFYLTNSARDEVDNLKHVFQQYHMHLERFKETASADFYKNANFVAWTNHSLSLQDITIINQILIGKVILIAFFYKRQVWTLSRIKTLQKSSNLSELNSTKASFTSCWLSFRNFFC